jgi:hypothetical protein
MGRPQCPPIARRVTPLKSDFLKCVNTRD